MDEKFRNTTGNGGQDAKSVFGSSMRNKGSEFGGTPAGKIQQGADEHDIVSSFEALDRNERVKRFSLNIPDSALPDIAPVAPNASHGDDVFSYSADSLSGKAEDYRELTQAFINLDADAPAAETGAKHSYAAEEKVEVERFSEAEINGNTAHPSVRRPSASAGATRSGDPRRQGVQRRPSSGAKSTAQRPGAGGRTAPKTGAQAGGRGTNPTKKGKKPMRGYSIASTMLGFACCCVFIFAVTGIAVTVAFATINDILAINKPGDTVTLVVPEGATFEDVVDIVADAGLIQQKQLCTLFAKFRHFDKYTKKDGTVVMIEYLSGIYYVEKDMGFEAILNTMKASNNVSAETVKLSFPEGWSAAQIFDKLEKNEVCEAEKLYANLGIVGTQYSFYAGIPSSGSRYLLTEGYLYPDTYEFFVGENANSVLKKLYGNFTEKWIDDYEQRRQTLGYSLDQIITVASILQREGKDKDQMTIIASIIYNRLKNSESFPQIQCDSTLNYAQKYIVPYVDSYNAQLYLNAYNTYSKNGLPPGPICNPGDDAIYSALHPADTDYLYFCHDKDGVLYAASTYEEHMKNYARTLNS